MLIHFQIKKIVTNEKLKNNYGIKKGWGQIHEVILVQFFFFLNYPLLSGRSNNLFHPAKFIQEYLILSRQD